MNPERALAHLSAILESADDAIVGSRLDGTILTWNPAAERIFGYTAAEAVGQTTGILLPEDRRAEEDHIGARICRGESIRDLETVRRRRNGALVDVCLTVSPICDPQGQLAGALQIARDITESKRHEARLRHFAAIVESSEDAIVSKTLEGIILTWNPGAERVYGYSAAEAVGSPMTLLLPADRPDEETEILARIGRGERVDHFETVRRKKDGSLIDVSLTISPIRDDEGRIVGASHIARDITERKHLDEQLRHTQKLESLGLLAGGVAHDFNNLLTGIMGNSSLALESMSADNPARSLLADVLNASERAALLTRQLLAYAGKGRFVVEPVNLSAMVREISDLIHTSIPKSVYLRLDLRDDVPSVQADASQLQQLVMNLVINAAEAIGPEQNGTVLVTTSVQNIDAQSPSGTFDGAGLTPGPYVLLEVHDTGCGMDDGILKRIFDPFFSTKFTGRGLGLAAVQGIVRAHKGAIKVHSRHGKGTTFKVLLPAANGVAPAPKSLPPPRPAARDELILVIDDEEVIRRTAKSMLERYGYTVVLAENGKQGVELFRVLADQVTAVLLDLTMPQMDGTETFDRLKSIKPGIKVILSSGYNEVETIRRFAGKGLAGFVQKPYSASTLVGKIRSVVEED